MSFVTQNASFSFHCICSSSSDRFVCWGLPNDLKNNKKNLELINILFLTNIPLAAIYPFYHWQQYTLYHKMWQILRREFLALSRFMLCRPCLPQIKDLPTIIDCELIRSFKKSVIFVVNCILLPLIHLNATVINRMLYGLLLVL